jgi:hypothetical protein
MLYPSLFPIHAHSQYCNIMWYEPYQSQWKTSNCDPARTKNAEPMKTKPGIGHYLARVNNYVKLGFDHVTGGASVM